MKSSESLFFIALLPTVDIQNEVTEIKQYFVEKYDSRHALKSPPHVTLQPPFKWSTDKLDHLEECLVNFSQAYSPLPITLSGFGAFPPRVIYVNVIKTPELLTLQKELMSYLETTLNIVDQVSKRRPFSPHMTVAFRDLTRQNFRAAWLEFEHQSLEYQFTVSQLTLLVHNGKRWNIKAEFPFELTF
ncbi:ligT like Phosphoesterase family protein [Lyngbya aestuarii BL J]|uniref:LigT like Phosphoesterase family protein n=1 Tax=Lyngbya aestuarii BL J TaxID=1348334 RepID=U7QP47_9CYAN|nr:2'-5' RNA ligase family protein [Lyngbya aestuarii]ERT09653.1 ligT like Phosphoesterase family protein [Lyngbya aestuarii BL J]